MLARINLAPVRFRKACAPDGPVARVEWTTLGLYGSAVQQANVWLKDGLRPRQKVGLYSDADGTGTASTVAVARHKAISESLERWAYDGTIGSDDAARFGFKIDPTSSGMAAFPGLVSTTARRAARLEAIERNCLMAWSDGLLPSRRRATEWSDIEAVEIDSPAGGSCVVLFRRNAAGFYAYGHAAADTFADACHRAVVELGRNEMVVARKLANDTSERAPANLFERRCLFFSSDEGFDRFQSRIGTGSSVTRWQPKLAVDAEIRGPWSTYATVWRVVFFPPSERFLSNELDCFVW